MAEDRLAMLLNELAEQVVMADAADKPSIGLLLQKVEDFKAVLDEITGEHAQSLRDNADSSIRLLTGILLDDSTDPAADLEAVSSHISQFQQTLHDAAWNSGDLLTESSDLGSGDAPTPLSPSSEDDGAATDDEEDDENLSADNVFELPAWVDEQTFRDFISNQPLVLEEIEADLLTIEGGDASGIAAFKRRIHTMKGEAGVLGLEELEELCHAMEDFVDGEATLNERVDTLLQARDWIAATLENYSEMRQPEIPVADLLEKLQGKTGAAVAPQAQEKPAEAVSETPSNVKPLPIETDYIPEAEPVHSVERDRETITMIGDFVNESREGLNEADQTLMECEQEEPDDERVNSLFRVFHTIKGVAGFLELKDITELAHVTETMLNMCRQGTLLLQGNVLDTCFDSTELMRDMIEDVQHAVEQHLSISQAQALPALLRRLNDIIEGRTPISVEAVQPEPDSKIGEMLLRKGAIDADTLEEALESQKRTGLKLGEQLVASGKVKPKDVGKALRTQKAGATASKIKETIKIDLDRVDDLVELIGELVIVESMVANAPEITRLSSLTVRNYLNQLTKITRDLQGVGMRMRMVPVRGVFQKMARMVRDLSRKNNKKINFVQKGESTEMDRSMVEHIADPLVHMIRNSVDHGIEDEAARKVSGKHPEGTINLSAYHKGGSIVIEISDDGRGLDKNGIRDKALKQGLIREGDTLSDQELFSLIFHPGFSTAKKVTEISGRGVGMDVVKRNIESLRGRILIDSVPGEGTTFKLVLPLTLAIIDGMLIGCGNERYILPTLSIIESIQPTADMLSAFAGQRELLNYRDEILPLVRLDSIFEINDAITDPTQGLVVIIESFGNKFGVLVDDVISQQQVVIKNVSDDLNDVKFISGAAIMSDGRVGLILNVDELSKIVNTSDLRMASNA